MLILQIINAVIALSTIIAACLALARPSAFSGSRNVVEGERFFANMYATRAIPLGILVGALPFISFASQWPTKALLIAAALVQIVDAIIGAGKKEWGMVGGAGVAFIVHGLTAWLI
ncbi:hypothetical protein [Propionibacterium ruminifibrarum]|uniref:hypothetical protein n=1 Tax=Propionibacterium ruminifibrarum TaxID=1962131 RepID=UPI001C718F4D|nr:hypothetical protein [Propionibacterium ruminifibrarum]